MAEITCARCGTRVVVSRAEAMRGICPRCLFQALVEPEPAAKSPLELLEGQELGNYVVLGLLGSGGMGVVYRARQKGLERSVALKVLNPPALAQKEDIERFFREARAAAKLQHPNIVAIHEVANDKGYYFFTMDLVDGRTLAGQTLDPRRAASILAKVARAVHDAHENGIVHRDLKPGNILLDKSDEPKVLDFGLAKDISASGGLTATGTAMGTPSYMPPEQAAGKRVDARTDVYALGAVLYECLTGRPPFTGATVAEVLRKVADEEPAPFRGTPRDIATICLKTLQKNPADRYATALALAEDLERFVRGESILGRRPGLLRRIGRSMKRDKVGASALTLAIVAAGASILFRQNRERPRPERGRIVDPRPTPPSEKARKLLEEARRKLEIAEKVRAREDRAGRVKWLEGALKDLKEALHIEPSLAEAFYLRGRVCRNLYRGEEALEHLTRAILLDPRHLPARYWRALTIMDEILEWRVLLLGRPDPYLMRLIREDAEALRAGGAPADQVKLASALPMMPEALVLLIMKKFGSRIGPRITELLNALDSKLAATLKADPTNPHGHYLRGLLEYFRERDNVEAARLAADYAPNDILFLSTLVIHLASLGRADESLQWAQAMRVMAPDLDETHLCLAFALHAKGDRAGRDAAIERARELTRRPGDVEIAVAFIELEVMKQGVGEDPIQKAMSDPARRDWVLAALDKAIALEPESPMALMLRGGIHLAINRTAEAMEDFRRFASFAPDLARVIPHTLALLTPPPDLKPFDRFLEDLVGARRKGRDPIDHLAACSMAREWFPDAAPQRALLLEIARVHAGRGKRDAVIRTIARLVDYDWHGWARLERDPDFARFAKDWAWGDMKARHALAPDEARRRGREHLEKGRQHLDNARRLVTAEFRPKRQDWLRSAVAELDRACELFSGDAEAEFALGLAFAERQQWSLAVEQFDETVRLDPDHGESRYRRVLANWALLSREFRGGRSSVDRHRVDGIRKDLERLRALRAPPDWVETGAALLSLTEVPDLQRKRSRHDPDYAREVLALADRLGGHADAIARANPGNGYGRVLRAFSEVFRSEEGKGPDRDWFLRELRAAVELDPTNLYFRSLLVEALRRTVSTEEALKAAGEAIEIAPGSEDPYVVRAEVLVRAGRKEEAWRDLERALEVAADPAYVRCIRANVLVGGTGATIWSELKSFDDDTCRRALAELDAALAAAPDDPWGLLFRGWLRLSPGRDRDGGRTDLNEFLRLYPDHPLREYAELWLRSP